MELGRHGLGLLHVFAQIGEPLCDGDSVVREGMMCLARGQLPQHRGDHVDIGGGARRVAGPLLRAEVSPGALRPARQVVGLRRVRACADDLEAVAPVVVAGDMNVLRDEVPVNEPLLLQAPDGPQDLDPETGNLPRGEDTLLREVGVERGPGHMLEGEVGRILAVGPANADERGAVVAQQARGRGLPAESLPGQRGGVRGAVVSHHLDDDLGVARGAEAGGMKHRRARVALEPSREGVAIAERVRQRRPPVSRRRATAGRTPRSILEVGCAPA